MNSSVVLGLFLADIKITVTRKQNTCFDLLDISVYVQHPCANQLALPTTTPVSNGELKVNHLFHKMQKQVVSTTQSLNHQPDVFDLT